MHWSNVNFAFSPNTGNQYCFKSGSYMHVWPCATKDLTLSTCPIVSATFLKASVMGSSVESCSIRYHFLDVIDPTTIVSLRYARHNDSRSRTHVDEFRNSFTLVRVAKHTDEGILRQKYRYSVALSPQAVAADSFVTSSKKVSFKRRE